MDDKLNNMNSEPQQHLGWDSPPTYTAAMSGGAQASCEMCRGIINVEGVADNVVVCSLCMKTTPIKPPPPGMKYVRCTSCTQLMVTTDTAISVVCTNLTCGQTLQLGAAPGLTPQLVTPNVVINSPILVSLPTKKYICGNCKREFVVANMSANFVVCPHCKKTTCINTRALNTQRWICLITGLIFLGVAIGVTAGTYEAAEDSGGFYVIYVGGFIVAIMMFIRCGILYSYKISVPVDDS